MPSDSVEQIRKLMAQLDNAEQRAQSLPPIRHMGRDYRGGSSEQSQQVQGAFDEAVLAAQQLPKEQRSCYMGRHMLARLRGEPLPSQAQGRHREDELGQVQKELAAAVHKARTGKDVGTAERIMLGEPKKTLDGEERPQPLRLEEVHGMMRVAEPPGPGTGNLGWDSPVGRKRGSGRGRFNAESQDESGSSAAPSGTGQNSARCRDRNDVSYELVTFAQRTAEARAHFGTSPDLALTNRATSCGTRDSKKEAARAARRAARQARIEQAEAARIAYGPTVFERGLRQKSQENFDKQSEAAESAEAARQFISLFCRTVLITIAMVTIKCIFILSEFTKTYDAEVNATFVPFAPLEAMIACSLGVVGGIILLTVLSVSRILLCIEGIGSPSLRRLVPFIVYSLYVTVMCFIISVTGFTCYLFDGLWTRMQNRLQYSDGFNTALLIMKMVFSILLPFIILFITRRVRSLILHTFLHMCERAKVQRHIFLAIRTMLILSAIGCVVYSSYRVGFFLMNMLQLDQSYPTINNPANSTLNATSLQNAMEGVLGTSGTQIAYPWLQFGFTSDTFSEVIDGCQYNIPVDPRLNLNDLVQPNDADYHSLSFLRHGRSMTDMFNAMINGGDNMLRQYDAQSGACELENALNVTATYFFVQDINNFLQRAKQVSLQFSIIPIFFPVLLAVVSLSLGVLYHYVALGFLKYEQARKDLPDLIAAVRSAGNRVQLLEGRQVIVHHMVDKPQLNGLPGKLMHDATDEQGRIKVLLTNQKQVLVEEWNLSKNDAADPDEAAKTKETAELRAIEVQYNHEMRGVWLNRREKFYTITCQILCGFLMHQLLTFYSAGRYSAVSILSVVVYSSIWSDASREHYVAELCDLWTKCVNGFDHDFCNTCQVQIPGVDLLDPVMIPDTIAQFFQGQFSGVVLTWMILGSVIGAAVTTLVVKCVGRAGWTATLLCGLVAAVLFALGGFGNWVLDPKFHKRPKQVDEVCQDPDAFVTNLGSCILETGVQWAGSFTRGLAHNALYIGFTVSQFAFVLESTFVLSTILSALRGANEWIKFQLTVFMSFFVVAILFLVLIMLLQFLSSLDYAFSIPSYRVIFFAQICYNLMGIRDLWSGEDGIDPLPPVDSEQDIMAVNHVVGFGSPASFFFLSIITVVQIIGLVVIRSVRDFEGNEAVLRIVRLIFIFDLIAFATYIFLIVLLAMDSTFFPLRCCELLFIPLAFQIVFVLYYALKSDVLPLSESLPASPVLARVVVVIQIVPFLSVILTTIGFAFVLSKQRMPSIAQHVGIPFFLAGLSGCAVTVLAMFYFWRRDITENIKGYFSSGWQKIEEELGFSASSTAESTVEASSAGASATVAEVGATVVEVSATAADLAEQTAPQQDVEADVVRVDITESAPTAEV